jgi:ligand-binding sensor domain-containing protein
VFDEGKLFVGTQGGGIFYSADTGKNWSAVNNGLTNLDITTLTITAGRVYAGSWGGGIFVSTNNGNHWKPINAGLNCNKAHVIQSSRTELFAGTSAGLYHSGDQGLTWIQLKKGLPEYEVRSLAFCLESVFAATDGHGVFLSNNRGESWESLNSGLSDSSVNVITMNNMSVFSGTSRKGVWMSALSDIFTLETNPDTLDLDWNTGSTQPLYIETNVEWTLQGFMPSWLTVGKSSGTGNDSLVFETLKSNITSSRRDAVFYLFSPKAKTITFTVSQKGRSEAVAETEVLSPQIFPNPTSGVFIIKSPVHIEKIRIYNPMGEFTKEMLPDATECSVNLSEERKGIYYISIYLKNRIFIRKIVLL